nr:MAG TPA: tail tape measure protein [Caudoviricetes sp.]
MAELKFKVQADWEKVQKLRDEISKLKQEIKGTDAIQDPTSFNKLNSKLQQTSKELGAVTGKIAEASAAMETDFKQKIYAASQGVNDLTEKIIAQKGVVRDVAADVRRLGEAYKESLKTSPMTSDVKLSEWKAAKRALEEEKAALFGLTQEQANARLSVKKLRDEYALLRQEGGGTAQTMDLLTGKLKTMSGMLLGGMGLKELAGKIISVRGEFESMETSLKVLLGGSEEKLNNIMGQIKEYALASPLNTKDMVGAVQMMTSFGIEAEKSIDYLKAIGDVSMGDAGKFNSLALAFSQMSSAGKLMGQDLMQMVNAGFNPLEEISRKTGKSIGELKNEMSSGAISSKMVQDAFISATSAGGKFFGMADEGSKTLNGQISMLQESFDNMFNEIGSKGEGIIMDAVQAGTYLVENYETIGKVLEGLLIAYGTYRTAIILNTALEQAQFIARAASITGTSALSVATGMLQKQMAALNITMAMNPYVAVAAAVIGLCVAVYTLTDRTTAAEEAQKRLDAANDEVEKSTSKEITKLNGLIEVLNSTKKGSKEWKAAKDAIISQYGKYDSKLVAEIERTGTLTGSYNRLTDAIRRSIAARQLKQFYDKSVQETEDANQKIRHEMYGTINKKYGNQVTRLLMQHLNDYTNGNKKALDSTIYYFKNGKKTKTTARALLNNVGSFMYRDQYGGLGSSGYADIIVNQANEIKRNNQARDASINRFADENGISKRDMNEVIYGIKDPSNGNNNGGNGDVKYTKALSDARTAAVKAQKALANAKKHGTKNDFLKAQDAYKKANEAYSQLSGKTLESEAKEAVTAHNKAVSDAKKAQKDAEKAEEDAQKAVEQQNEANEKAFELKTKTQIENARKAEDLANETEQAEIDILKDGNEKKLRQIELNHKKEQQAVDRAFEDIKQRRIEQAKQAWEANPKNKGKNFYESTSYNYASSDERYTTEEHTNYDSKTKAAWHKYDEEVKKIQEEEKATNEKRTLAIISYLKEYGTMQEKRLAIAKVYDAKIEKAETEGDRLSLNAQKAKAIADFDLKNEKDNLNWDEIFGDIGNQTIKQLEVVKGRLREMLSSDNLNVTDYKAIVEQIEKVNNAIVDSQDKQKKFFNFSTEHGKERRKLEMDVADALERQASAAGRLSVATLRNMEKQRNARQSVENVGVKIDGDISTANIDNILKQIEDKYGKDSAQYKEVQKAMDALAASERDLINANEQKKKSDNDVSKSQGKLNKFINDFNENMKAFMSAFSLVLNNLNDLPDLLSKFGVSDDSDLMKGAKEIVTAGKEGMQAIKDFQSGNFVGAAAHGMESAGAIGRAAITLFGGNGNETAMEKEIERLAKANEGLSKAIDTLSNNIEKKDNTNSQSVDAYKKAKKAEEEWESNQRKAINNRAKEYANTGYGFLKLGGRSSFNAFANENKKIWTSFNATLQSLGSDKRVSRAEDLWNLSPELLKQLQANNNTAWRELFNNKGHKNPKELVDEYIERAGKAEELADKLNEKLTGYSWDGFKDSYLSALEDMESDTETFANNINNVIGKAILNSLVNSSDIQERIKKIHKMIADAAEDDNFTENEVDAIRKENSSLSDILLQRRESLKAMGLLVDSNESQKATANGVTSITFEQASNIIALTTAGNISRDQIKDLITAKLSTIDVSVRGLQSLIGEQRNIADELRTIQANSYLELQGIHEDTTSMNKTLKEMSSNVLDIKRNIKDM